MKAALVLLAMGSAAAIAADFSGHYTLQGVREVGSELLLKPDGSFEFMLAYGAADFWGKGTWRGENDAVVLESAPRKDTPPFRLVRSSAAKAAAIRVRVQGPGGNAVPNIDVVLATEKDKLEGRTDSDGIAVFPRSSPPRNAIFRIRVYNFESEPLKLNPEHDDFTFEIHGETIMEWRFAGERLAAKGNALVMRRAGMDQEMRYVKED
jgi:hypothetical protein